MPFEGSQQFQTALVYTLCVSSWCRYLLEWREEDSRVNRLVITSYLTHIFMAYSAVFEKDFMERDPERPLRAVFMAYFRLHCPDILCLICCPGYLRREVLSELKQHGILLGEASSRLPVVPERDKFFVFVSGGIQPCNVEDDCYLW